MKSILFYPKKWRKFLSMTVFFRCQFPSGALTGNLNVDHAMCVLSLNIINDKIFLLEWLWFYILALVSSASVIISVILVILPPSRKLWLRYKCLLFCTSKVARLLCWSRLHFLALPKHHSCRDPISGKRKILALFALINQMHLDSQM